MWMEIVNLVKTRSAVDISHHGHLGQHVRSHAVVVFKSDNKNLFLIRSIVILKSRKEPVRQMHALLWKADAVEDEMVEGFKARTLHLIKSLMSRR